MVVKPIWLLMTKWIEPPVRWPLRPESPRHSAITPWPANAASPWSSSGITIERSTWRGIDEMAIDRRALVLLGARLAEHHRIDDLEMADGLAVSDRCTLLPSNSRSDEAPR